MKLLQKIVLLYYRYKIALLEKISIDIAGRSAFQLFCTPYTRRRKYAMPAIFQKAEQLSFEFQQNTIRGFRYKPAQPNGNKLLICHGFDSYSYRFEKYLAPLRNAGFEVLAFDAPAHGLSSGKTINALVYSGMIEAIDKKYGPLNVVIAHSFGALAATLAIEKMQSKQIKRLVLIAPATETTRSINDFCRHLHLSNAVKAELEKIIVQMGGNNAAFYSVARIVPKLQLPVLWLHDKYDKITPYEDMQHLTQAELPFVTFHITQGLGHSLYRTDAIAKLIIGYVKKVQ